jgi:hypothetical protein
LIWFEKSVHAKGGVSCLVAGERICIVILLICSKYYKVMKIGEGRVTIISMKGRLHFVC